MMRKKQTNDPLFYAIKEDSDREKIIKFSRNRNTSRVLNNKNDDKKSAHTRL